MPSGGNALVDPRGDDGGPDAGAVVIAGEGNAVYSSRRKQQILPSGLVGGRGRRGAVE